MAKLRAMGMDPSMNNWGIAAGVLETNDHSFTPKSLQVIQAEKPSKKQVRVNSIDLEVAKQLGLGLIPYVEQQPHIIFVEVPVGSQSAASMKGYGICIGLLGFMRATGTQFVEVTPTQVKVAMTGNRNATKKEMIEAAMAKYPNAPWPMRGGKVVEGKAEHMADAIGAIVAGLASNDYQQLAAMLQAQQSFQ